MSHHTNVNTKLLHYNIYSLHDPKYLVAPENSLEFSSLSKIKIIFYSKWSCGSTEADKNQFHTVAEGYVRREYSNMYRKHIQLKACKQLIQPKLSAESSGCFAASTIISASNSNS